MEIPRDVYLYSTKNVEIPETRTKTIGGISKG
jgi:hypothetical protein